MAYAKGLSTFMRLSGSDVSRCRPSPPSRQHLLLLLMTVGMWIGDASLASSSNVHASAALSRGSPAITWWCGAGATSQGMTGWWDSHASEFASYGETLPALSSAVDAAGRDLTDAVSEICQYGSTTTRQASLAAARSSHDLAQATYRNALVAIRVQTDEAIVAQSGSEGLALASRMEANAHRPVPDAFKCLEFSDDGWQILQSALRKTEQGLSLAPDELTALSAANSSALVQTVAQRIATNGPALEAWFAEHAHAAATSASAQPQ